MLNQLQETIILWFKSPIFSKVIVAVAGVLVIGLFFKFVKRALPRYIKDTGSLYRLKKLITFISYAVLILFLIGIFSDKMRSITVALGIAGAGIAFALQEVIMSVAGWIALTFGHFYKIGNRIQLAGITGDVIDIGVLRTTLMECGQWIHGDQYNGRIVRISNSFVFKEPVFNYSADFPFLWDEISLPVQYGCEYKHAREIIIQVAYEVVGDYVNFARETWKEMVKKYMIEDAKVEPMVTTRANDNWVEFTLRYVVDFKLRRSVKDRLFMRILEEFDKTAGKVVIASTSTDIRLLQTPKINIKLEDKDKE